MITLTGPGGVGKTRLALHVGERWTSDFTDGITFVPLAGIEDPDRVAAMVAETLGVFDRAARDPVLAVQNYLEDRAFLLILDNFEHLLSAAPVLTHWLSHCRWLTMLVTSRFRLHLTGEHEIVIAPLPLPECESGTSLDRMRQVPSVDLFIARARAAHADFELTTTNADTLAMVCRHLEGLPLSIELAAARMAHMGPGDLLQRLQRGLPALSNGPHDQPDRLRTLEDTIEWSYQLLSEPEQTLLQRLAVFAGGFDLDAAGAIAGVDADPVEGIASLVDKSFLTIAEIDGFYRYTMLESIREFAAARLETRGETVATRLRHAAYFLELAEREDEAIWGGHGHRRSLDRLEVELANLRAALTWLESTGDGSSLLRLAAALGGTWHYRSHWLEGRTWLAKGLLLGGDAVPAARATALVKLTILNRDLGEPADPAWAAEAIQLRREIGDLRGIGRAMLLAASMIPMKDAGIKWAMLAEAEGFCERADNASGLAWINMGRSSICHARGDLDDAHDYMQESVVQFRRGRFPFGIFHALISLAFLDSERGHIDAAVDHYAEALMLWDETRSTELLVGAISRIAELAVACGEPESGLTLLSSLDALGQSVRLCAIPADLERAARLQEEIRACLRYDQFLAAWQRGAQSTTGRLIAEAIELLRMLPAPLASAPLLDAGGLTVREVDVIRLLSAGKSNREIAVDLSISESTAISHVRNILSKLGLGSRTAAAAWAIRHGLDQSA